MNGPIYKFNWNSGIDDTTCCMINVGNLNLDLIAEKKKLIGIARN